MRRGVTILSLLLLAGLATFQDVSAEEIPTLDLSRVDPAVREQLSQKRHELDALLAQNSESPALFETLSLLGRLYLAYDYLEAGVACLEAALRRDPGDFAVQYLLGYGYDRVGDRDTAALAFEKSLKIAPDTAIARLRLGNLLLSQQQSEAAAVHFEHAYRVDPNCLGALYGLGEIARRSRDDETAARYFQQAVDKAPDATQVRYALGLALRRLGRLDEAKAHLSKADWKRLNFGGWLGCSDPLLAEVIELTTGAPAHLMRGAQAAFKGRPDIEISEYRKAVAANPKDAVAQANLGTALYARGELDEAASHYSEAIRLNPNDATYRHDLGQILMDQGAVDQAAGHFSAAAELNPRFKEARSKLAGILLQKGRFQEAADHSRGVIAIDPMHRQARVQLSMALLRLGQRVEATTELASVMDDLPPENLTERLQLATLLATLGDLDRAEQHFIAVKEQATESQIKALAHSRIGRIQGGRGQIPAAIESFRKAVELDPTLEEAKALLGQLEGR